MGIRFNCPNGHQLNIKSFLAGKRGICPDCGVRFVIPLESGGVATIVHKGEKNQTVPEATVAAASPATQAVAQTAAPVAAPAAAPNANTNVAPMAAPVATAASPTVARPIIPLQAPAASPAYPANAPPTAPQVADPFLEAPQASWYVRPRTGGQFGPALPEVMRRWISEGRVSRDSLVWRDGWADWQGAVETFPELADTADVGRTAGSAQPISTSAARARARRSSNQLTLAMVVLMIFLAIVLLAGLIYVVSGQSFSGNGQTNTASGRPTVCTTAPLV